MLLKRYYCIMRKVAWLYFHIKTMKTYCISCKKNAANKSSNVKGTKDIDQCMYQIVLSVPRKNWGSLKIKNKEDYNAIS